MPRPEQATSNRRRRRHRHRHRHHHIPDEIVEEILLNLPAKSLLRFSSVSKSWQSMISESGFIKKHHSRAALRGRESIALSPSKFDCLERASSSCRISSISAAVTNNLFPIRGVRPLLALCDEFWCVSVSKRLYLWNPSMGTHKKLRAPRVPPSSKLVYGLGYDSVGDDYKIVKLDIFLTVTNELYSLRNNSWKRIDRPRVPGKLQDSRGVFVSGALHWIPCHLSSPILVFDLSTDKFGTMKQPEYSPTPSHDHNDKVELTVLRGKLCAYLNYNCWDSRFVLWVMEEYGVASSWTRSFDIQNYNTTPYFHQKFVYEKSMPILRITPLYFYDNGEILIKVSAHWPRNPQSLIVVYKNYNTMPREIVGGDKFGSALIYVECLISPATWPMPFTFTLELQ